VRAPRTRLTWRPNAWQESTSIARAEVTRQTAPAALQENSHPLAPQAVSRRRARPIQTRRRAVSLACVTQDIRGRTAGHVKLAALGRTRTRLAPSHALHASPASISLPSLHFVTSDGVSLLLEHFMRLDQMLMLMSLGTRSIPMYAVLLLNCS